MWTNILTAFRIDWNEKQTQKPVSEINSNSGWDKSSLQESGQKTNQALDTLDPRDTNWLIYACEDINCLRGRSWRSNPHGRATSEIWWANDYHGRARRPHTRVDSCYET